MDFRSVTEYADFGDSSNGPAWKFGLPCQRLVDNANCLASLDSTCLYVDSALPDQHWPVVALADHSQIERVVFRNCEPKRSAVHSLPKNLKHQWFIFTSAELLDRVWSDFLDSAIQPETLGILVDIAGPDEILKWTRGRPATRHLALGYSRGVVDVSVLTDQLPSLQSLCIDVQDFVYDAESEDFRELRSTLQTLSDHLSHSRIEKLVLRSPCPSLPIVEGLVSGKGNQDQLKCVSIEMAFFSDESALAFSRKFSSKHCSHLRLSKCTFESIAGLTSILASMPGVQYLDLLGLSIENNERRQAFELAPQMDLAFLDMSEVAMGSALASVLFSLITPSLGHLSLNSVDFSEDSHGLAACAIGRCRSLQHLDLSNTGQNAELLLTALPRQSNQLRFAGVRNLSRQAVYYLEQRCESGIRTLYASDASVWSSGPDGAWKCSIEQLQLADQDSASALLESLADQFRALKSICIPSCDIENICHTEWRDRLPKLRFITGLTHNIEKHGELILYPAILAMEMAEQLEHLSNSL